MLICRILAKSHADTAAGIFTFILFSFIVIGIVLLCLYNLKKKTIFVYGYSNAYGRYDHQHEKSVEMLKEVYPDYKITWSNDGY